MTTVARAVITMAPGDDDRGPGDDHQGPSSRHVPGVSQRPHDRPEPIDRDRDQRQNGAGAEQHQDGVPSTREKFVSR